MVLTKELEKQLNGLINTMHKYQNLKLFKIPNNFYGKSRFVLFLWRMVNFFLFKLSPDIMFNFRNFLLRLFGAKIGKNVLICSSADIHYPWKLEIGDNSWIGYNTKIYNLGKVSIGNNVAIAHDVYLCDSYHDITKTSFDIIFGEIIIYDEAWIANDVFVGPNVTINKGCVIASRSSVYKSMPEGYVCKGNPCEPYKIRKNTKK